MKIIKPRVEMVNAPTYSNLLSLIEQAGRTCYKSESKITDDSAEKFVRNILKRGHEAVIEHGSVTLRIICDRGVSHEIVRHRMASYCQESTRYCNYGKDDFGSEITVIQPRFVKVGTDGWELWRDACAGSMKPFLPSMTGSFSTTKCRTITLGSAKRN